MLSLILLAPTIKKKKTTKAKNHFHWSGSKAVMVAYTQFLTAEASYTKGICVLRSLRQVRPAGLKVHQVRCWPQELRPRRRHLTGLKLEGPYHPYHQKHCEAESVPEPFLKPSTNAQSIRCAQAEKEMPGISHTASYRKAICAEYITGHWKFFEKV